MKIIVLGAGHVGQTLVDSLHAEHDLTVIDTDGERLSQLADHYDVRTVRGDATNRRIVEKAGGEETELLLACSPREEANLVCALLVRRYSGARTVMRTTSAQLLDAWRGGEIDVDFMISPELETANAIAGIVGLPAARQTDVFAEGKVQIVEFDVGDEEEDDAIVGRPLREAEIPEDSKVVGLIRGGRMEFPHGHEEIRPGDRIVVIASPDAALEWNRILGHDRREVRDVVIFGCGSMGITIARVLCDRGLQVRLVDSHVDRAREVAQELPEARVFHADAFDRGFLERQRIHRAAAVFALNNDAKNLFGATLSKVHGVDLTITLVDDPGSAEVYEHGGVDVAINPRELTAEEMIRFAHDSRIQQISMLEGHRFEVLDVTVRADSKLANIPFKELPTANSLIGAVIRDGSVLFPHGTDVLEAGDRAILFVESAKASAVAKAL